MKLYRKRIGLACVAALGLSLSACGGGGSTAPTATAGIANTTGVVQLAGVVVDGYMKGATAFVDRNNNGQLDAGEPSSITNAAGAFTLTGLQAGDENYPVVVDVPPAAIDSDTGKPVGKHSVMNAPAPGTLKQKVVISPITTMIKTVMDNTPNTDKYAAAAKVKKDLNLANPASVDLFADYVAAKKTNNANAGDYAKIHKVAQVVARTVANQVASVKAAVTASNTAASLTDVISLITAQVVNQLVAIDNRVTQTATWTPAQADSIAVNDTVPLDTTSSTNFTAAINNQISATQAATKTAKAAADLANATAQAALAQAKIILAQAQQLQDQYAASVSTYTYVLAQSAANKVKNNSNATVTQKAAATAAVAADPYATFTQKAAATSAATLAAATPVITLLGSNPYTIALGSSFVDPGSVVTDDIDKNLTAMVTGSVNTQALGSNVLLYNVTDSSGNKASPVTRTVIVVKDTVAPVIAYTGAKIFNLKIGQAFVVPTVTVTDNIDKNLKPTVVNNVNSKVVGNYQVTYNAKDSSGNLAIPVVLTVQVTDQTAPVISLLGSNPYTIAQGSNFVDAGSTVKDNYSTGLTATVTGTVNPMKVGVYTLTYNAKDAAGNIAKQITRTVKVTDQTAPVISLLGSNPYTIAQGSTFVDAGSTVTDNYSTGLTATVTGTVNPMKVGVYTLTYNAKDAAGNTAIAMTRTVNVTDQTAPVISLLGSNPYTIAQGSTFVDAGSTVTDNYSTGLTATVTGTVNPMKVGVYTLTYNAKDAAGNTAIAKTRTVNVTAPIIATPAAPTLGSLMSGGKSIGAYLDVFSNAVGANQYRYGMVSISPTNLLSFQDFQWDTPSATFIKLVNNANNNSTFNLSAQGWSLVNSNQDKIVDRGVAGLLSTHSNGLTTTHQLISLTPLSGLNISQALPIQMADIGNITKWASAVDIYANFSVNAQKIMLSSIENNDVYNIDIWSGCQVPLGVTQNCNVTQYQTTGNIKANAVQLSQLFSILGSKLPQGNGSLQSYQDIRLVDSVNNQSYSVSLMANATTDLYGEARIYLNNGAGLYGAYDWTKIDPLTGNPALRTPAFIATWHRRVVLNQTMIELNVPTGMVLAPWMNNSITKLGFTVQDGYVRPFSFTPKGAVTTNSHLNDVAMKDVTANFIGGGSVVGAQAQISGTIANNSTATGNLTVAVFASGGKGSVGNVTITGNSYTVNGLVNGSSYYTVLFIDTNANGVWDQNTEPGDAAPVQIVAGQPLTNVNFSIEQYVANGVSFYWGAGAVSSMNFKLTDMMATATSVTVSGPGLTKPMPLTFSAGKWSGTLNGITLTAGAKYTYTVVDNLGGKILTQSLVNPMITDAPASFLPANGTTVTGTPTFSWKANAANTPTSYGVQISNNGWQGYTSATNLTYTGPALTAGTTYSALITAEYNYPSRSGIMNHATFSPSQSFTYQAATVPAITQISGTIANNSAAMGTLSVAVYDSYTNISTANVSIVGNNYSISGLANVGLNYVLLFLDQNGNGVWDQNTEPVSFRPVKVVAGQTQANINLAIEKYDARGTTRCWNNGAMNTYDIDFRLNENGVAASNVSIAGGQLLAPLALTYDAYASRWYGTPTVTAPKANTVYTFKVTDAQGVFTYPVTTSTFSNKCITSASLNKQPVDGSTVIGTPTFTWNRIAGADYYVVELFNGAGGPSIWSAQGLSGTSVVYNGPALVPGSAYSFTVTAGFTPTNGTLEHQARTTSNSFIYQAAGLPVNPYGTAVLPVNPYGTAGLPVNPYGTAGVPVNPYGTVGLPVNPYGTAGVPVNPYGVTLTVYDESVWYNAWQNSGSTPSAAKQQKLIAQGVIAGAKIVVDNAKTYTTDASGQVTIPGIDVGLHDIAMFANGFTWSMISQVTFDPAKKNQFALTPSQQQGFNNGGNSRLLLAVNLPAAQPANTVVELSIADAYGNVYTASTWQQYNNATATNYFGADFQNIRLNPGTTISGVMTAREITCDIYGMNCTETNAGNLGNISFVTQSWNAQQAPAGTVNVVYAATHVTVPVVGRASAQPVIGLNITNSYAAPGTMVNGQVPQIQLNYTYTDSYGNARSSSTWANVQTVGVYDAYGAYIGQKVAPGTVQVSLWGITDSYGNPLPIGTVITARMTALEMSYNAATNNNWVTTNVANLGLQTITIQASPYPGFPAQPLPASSIKTQIAVNFPATPPTPTTVLTVQSIVPPTGIVMNQGMGVDNWNTATQPGSTVPLYNDYVSSSFVNGVQQGMFPHTFTSYQALTGNLNFYVSGSDAYAQAQWNYDTVVPVGAVVNYASQMTTPLNVSPYQTGNIIKVTPVNGGALTTGGMSLMMFDAYTKVQIWKIHVPSNVTSITLPTVPAGIVNHMVKGNPYLMDVDTTVFMGAGSPTNMTQLMYSYGVNPFATGLVNSSREWYVIPNIPYKY